MLPKYCSSYQVKPSSKKCKTGYQSVGIECYGGGIWHTWFDRDLTVAGRVLVKVRAGTRYEITLHDLLGEWSKTCKGRTAANLAKLVQQRQYYAVPTVS